MNKRHLERVLESELKKINEAIDMKIIQGLPYIREAKRHKLLSVRLNMLRKEIHPSIFARFGKFSSATAFFF